MAGIQNTAQNDEVVEDQYEDDSDEREQASLQNLSQGRTDDIVNNPAVS